MVWSSFVMADVVEVAVLVDLDPSPLSFQSAKELFSLKWMLEIALSPERPLSFLT